MLGAAPAPAARPASFADTGRLLAESRAPDR
jgi:hypothetical protein